MEQIITQFLSSESHQWRFPDIRLKASSAGGQMAAF